MPTSIDEYGTSFLANFVNVNAATMSKVAFNLNGANVVFLFRRPDGTVVEKGATITSTKKGTAEYIVEDGFLDQIGPWEWQPRIEMPTGQWWGQKEQFIVSEHLTPTT